MTPGASNNHHTAGPDVVRGQAVYLPAAVEAYRSRPRGRRQLRFDPGTMQPRWRYAKGAITVLALVLVAALATPVQFGTSGTIVDVSGDLVVVASNPERMLGWEAEVTLVVGDDRFPATVATENHIEDGPTPVQVTVVALDEGGALSEEAVGRPALLKRGTRPLLVDLARRGRQ